MASFDRYHNSSRARLVCAKVFSILLTLVLVVTLSVPPLVYADTTDAIDSVGTTNTTSTTTSSTEAQAQAAATSEPLAISVEYDRQNLKCNTPIKFTMQGSGGTGNYLYLQNAMQRQTSSGALTDDADWTRKSYTTDNTFEYTFVAPGTYRMVVYVMDKGTTPVQTKRLVEWIKVTDDSALAVEQVADSIANDCLAQGYKTDYEKALYVHDWIMNNATYDHDLLYDGESGVLIRGTGTCESYHRAFALVLGRLGIPCERAVGNGHVWSCVKLDGKWTQIDLTWDDSDRKPNDPYVYMSHIYFGMTDDMAKAVHSEHKPVAERACTSYDNSYFLKSGEITRWSDPVESKIRERIAAGETSFTIEAESNIYPSVYDIIYPLVPYKLAQVDWGLSRKSVEITYVKTDRKAAHYEVKVVPLIE